MDDIAGYTPWGRTEGCRVEGSVCYKDSPDCQWSVALGKEGVGDRQVWALKVGGRCGRMAIGLALDVDEVVRAPGGWTARECENKVWYYSSTGALRAGPKCIIDSGLKFGDGDVILLDWNVCEGELRIARGVATSEPARVGFSSRSQPLPAMRPLGVHGATHSRQLHTFEYLPALTLCDETRSLKPEEASGGVEALVNGQTVDLSKVRVAVTMFFDGACCELRALEPTKGFPLHDHRVEPENWAPRLLAAMPDFTMSSQSTGDAPAGGPPSVPRLSLTGVGDVSALSGLSRGGPGSGREGLTGPVSGGREGSGSDRRMPSPDPAGPLSSRSGGEKSMAGNSPGRSIAVGGDGRGALGLGGLRPSPRLGGGGPPPPPSGVGSSRTPRGLSITSHSPQITPRNQNPPASPTRALMSPRHSAAMSERFVSPRVPSPRTTPRGTLVPSPRKPLEALPATLTLQQHQKLEAMLNRIDTLEAMVTRTLAENRRLQAQVKSASRAAGNCDVCEVGLDGRAAPCPAAAVVEQQPHAGGGQTGVEMEMAGSRAPRAIKFRDEADEGLGANALQGAGAGEAVRPAGAAGDESSVKADTDKPTNAPATAEAEALLSVAQDPVTGNCRHKPEADAADGAGRARSGIDKDLSADDIADGVMRCSSAQLKAPALAVPFEAAPQRGGDLPSVSTCSRLSDIWEIDPAEVRRIRCIGRGACGTVWEAEWRRARVAVKDLDLPTGCAADNGTSVSGLTEGGPSAMGPGPRGHDRGSEMLASFRGEVAQLSCLRHPHVLAFYGAVSRGDGLCMLVELMERDVRSYLRGAGREAALEARLRIGLGALSGLRYLHSRVPKVVHRDIKPENLLLSHHDSVVKICDLGLARTKQGAFLQTKHHGGTLCYVAPEVHRGGDIDEGCDVYAMAIVLWELATLRVPFADKPPQSIPGIVGWGAERPPLAYLAAARATPCTDSGEDQEGRAAAVAAAAAEGCMNSTAWSAASMDGLSALLDNCWAQDPAERQSSAAAHHALDSILHSLTASSATRSRSGGGSAGTSEASGGKVPEQATGNASATASSGEPPLEPREDARGARPGPLARHGGGHANAQRRPALPRPPSPRARESGDI